MVIFLFYLIWASISIRNQPIKLLRIESTVSLLDDFNLMNFYFCYGSLYLYTHQYSLNFIVYCARCENYRKAYGYFFKQVSYFCMIFLCVDFSGCLKRFWKNKFMNDCNDSNFYQNTKKIRSTFTIRRYPQGAKGSKPIVVSALEKSSGEHGRHNQKISCRLGSLHLPGFENRMAVLPFCYRSTRCVERLVWPEWDSGAFLIFDRLIRLF